MRDLETTGDYEPHLYESSRRGHLVKPGSPRLLKRWPRRLKSPYVEISLNHDNEFKIAAAYGSARQFAVQLPLVYNNDVIGGLNLAPPFWLLNPSERKISRKPALLDSMNLGRAGVIPFLYEIPS